MVFTHLEKCDMLECYIFCQKNSREARVRYSVIFPNRNLPTESYFLRLYRKFRANENLFSKTRAKKDFIVSEATEINVLGYFAAQPTKSITDLSEESGLCLGTIHRILKKHKFSPFKFRPTQTLVPGDHQRRIEFCEWFVTKSNLNPDFWRLILWSDESNFCNKGLFNRKNTHHWSRENPKLARPCNPQNRFSVNVWCGLIGNKIVGPRFYQGSLTGARYFQMITEILTEFLDDLNLEERQQCYFQQDGAPAHNVRQVDQLLQNFFNDRYLSTNGPVRMPPRSPDINPLDFYFWGDLKDVVYARQYDTLQALQQGIVDAINNINGNTVAKATRSVYKRCQKCLELGGDVFEHVL